jgi:diguanylate cyclase (GGDEF)-like protein
VSTITPTAGQVACSMSSVLLRRLRQTGGERLVHDVLAKAGVDHTPEYLGDPANWIWYREAVALFEAAVELTGDERLPQRVGEDAVRQHAGSPVATLLRGLGSPQAVYEQLTVAVTKFSTVTELHPVEVSPGRAVVRARAREGFGHHPHMCAWRIGLLSTPTVLFGLAPARVEHRECALRGDEHCVYVLTWDADAAEAAGDPQQIITALESQLAAMTDRLDSMYATARDLIALDDVDGALQRITERAATAVRVPTYLLAVHTGEDQRLHVHHRGLGGADLDEEARRLLEGDPDADESRLVAEVASATRHYGRIMAASPAGAFFPHERDLFAVYARYAAAVLDTYSALDAARRREAQSTALLGLAQAVASASTTDDVARRLADAVPSVVDSDRVIVFLWDEAEQALACAAATATGAPVGEDITSLRIRPSETVTLASLVADPNPQPRFFDGDADDPYVRGILRTTGSQALIVAPIVAHERFYGILNVSVVERAERLSPTPELLGRLAGVVAQAATALDNARLIDEMSEQARTDNLTGLLGHRAFHETLGEAVAAGGEFTLASVDIDDFKRVNDRHGHPVGDQALRCVAAALRRSVRDADLVFRVGGEEFAVLMPGLGGRDAATVAERLRAAVAEATFDPPLRVSVGLASWPHDAGDGETLLERADVALYAAKRGGKDRVRLVADVGAGAAGDVAGEERRRALEVARALGLDDARAGEVEAVLARVLGHALRAA